MSDLLSLLNELENMLPYVKIAAVVIGIVSVLIAAASITYIAQTSCRPLFVVLQWMVAYTPGEKPGEIIQGISIGARMLVWSVLIGLVVWFLFH